MATHVKSFEKRELLFWKRLPICLCSSGTPWSCSETWWLSFSSILDPPRPPETFFCAFLSQNRLQWLPQIFHAEGLRGSVLVESTACAQQDGGILRLWSILVVWGECVSRIKVQLPYWFSLLNGSISMATPKPSLCKNIYFDFTIFKARHIPFYLN